VLGPDSLGVIAPHRGIAHTGMQTPVRPGKIAFVTQSASLGAATLDWAFGQGIGFSSFISLGQSRDVDFGECIDYLAEDPYTTSILLYIESIRNAGEFLSAAREAALRKPIIVLKAGRRETATNAIFDAAFRRCGVLRVHRLAELFYLAEILSRQPRPRGPKLAIITNANGPALLAADMLHGVGGEAPRIVDLGGSANAALFRQAGEAAVDTDGLLFVVTPQPGTDVEAIATTIRDLRSKKTTLASFMGGPAAQVGAERMLEGNVPNFPYADTAARAFHSLWRYTSALNGLYETPNFSAEDVDLAALRLTDDSPETVRRLFGVYGIDYGERQPAEGAMRFQLRCGPDDTFGPVLQIGAGGLGESIYEDVTAALPPLTSTLARRTLEQLRIARALPSRGMEALQALLVRFSRLVSENPVLRTVECEPVFACGDGAWVGEARVSLYQPDEHQPRTVIRPYPAQYVLPILLRDGSKAVTRPIRPEDEAMIVDFHEDLSERSVYLRYLQFLKFEERISHERLARVCFNDYARELALVVEQEQRILGVGRMQRNPLRMEEAEVAFLVRDSAQGKGVGGCLVRRLLAAAEREGVRRLHAELLSDNGPMRHLLERAGFRLRLASDGRTLLASLRLPLSDESGGLP
jgi:RimJ/RimL family protein N-acetyltransferase